MTNPSGFYSYDNPEIQRIIEEIAKATANKCKTIAYLDKADIEQEVRMKCLESLRHYDPNRSSANIRTFLITCVNNKMRDLRRSLLYKYNIPCNKCDFFDTKNNKCVKYINKSNCSRLLKHERYVLCKLTSGHAIIINESQTIDEKELKNQDKFLLLDFIRASLPSNMIWMIDALVESNFDMSIFKPREKADLIFYLSSVIDEFYTEED